VSFSRPLWVLTLPVPVLPGPDQAADAVRLIDAMLLFLVCHPAGKTRPVKP
jgi:hypothetical protein